MLTTTIEVAPEDVDNSPMDLCKIPGCENPSYDRDYWKWERDIAIPTLEAAGYSSIKFFTSDGDSFGPLVRSANATDKNGNPITFYYG